MKNVAVIAEYNPFHKGHAHQLRQLKEKEGAEAVLVVMSGDYVQRGEPAVADKAARTRMALAGGADMVVELPPAFATGSAEIFARGAVSLAAACGCIDTLAFGASCTDLARLKKAADSLLSHGYTKETANRAALFVEEIGLTVLDVNKQSKKPVSVELSLFFEDDHVLIIERDSGKLFDPTDPDAEINGLSGFILSGLMEAHDEKAYLVTTGYNRNMIRFSRT